MGSLAEKQLGGTRNGLSEVDLAHLQLHGTAFGVAGAPHGASGKGPVGSSRKPPNYVQAHHLEVQIASCTIKQLGLESQHTWRHCQVVLGARFMGLLLPLCDPDVAALRAI